MADFGEGWVDLNGAEEGYQDLDGGCLWAGQGRAVWYVGRCLEQTEEQRIN